MITHKCDREGCTAQADGQRGKNEELPIGWYLLVFGKYASGKKFYHICSKCCVALGLTLPVNDRTVGEKLLDIIENLVTEEVEAQRSNL